MPLRKLISGTGRKRFPKRGIKTHGSWSIVVIKGQAGPLDAKRDKKFVGIMVIYFGFGIT
jgi:hypothetical protein